MKVIHTFICIIISFAAVSQIPEVKMREETLVNGMNYPQVVIPDNKANEDLINADLKKHILPLDSNDFCIGQYGYVQKGTHLQIHVFGNCIDFDESKNWFYLYNLENGQAVPYSSLLNPKKTKEASELLVERITAYTQEKGFNLPDELEKEISEKNFDALYCQMKRNGMEFWTKDGSWGEERMFINWTDMRSVLKFQFL